MKSLNIILVLKDSHCFNISDERHTRNDSTVYSKQSKYMHTEIENIKSKSKNIKIWMIWRKSYERRKEQKLYIIECYENSKIRIFKIAQMLMLEYSSAHSIIKEYQWQKENSKETFSSINEKNIKRMKESDR